MSLTVCAPAMLFDPPSPANPPAPDMHAAIHPHKEREEKGP